MKFQPLPIYGGSYADDTKSWSAQDVLGWLPSNAEVPGTKTEGMFKTPPGLRPFAEVPPTGGGEDPLIPSPPVRGAWNAEGKMFVVIGTTFYQLSNAGVFIPIGTIPGTGRVIFSHNQVSLGNQVLAVNGSAGYIYDTRDQTFQRITDPGYPGAFVATFIDGYFVQISANRRFAFNSDVANGLEYNTLDRFTSEFSPDLLVSLVASNNELFLLSETSGEFFENTGAAQQPFRSKRITMDRGCAGAYTVAKADNTVFWLGNNGYFYVLNGYAPQRISTRAIEQSILGKNWKQCFAFAWEDAGHTVIYWTFPDGLTWGYDTSTGLWHRRESYGLSRWRVNTMTFWNQEWYAGDFQYGRIWKMDWNYALEGDQEFPSERTTAVIHDNQNRIIIPRLELLMQVGQEETVPVEFPEQPEGPTITAPPLPDGSVGISWAGGTYTATGGTPPYNFSSRPGTVWPGILGPMSSAGVVAAEIPNLPGSGSNIARVTDSNGLFDEVVDPFSIGVITAMLGVAASNFFLIGPGGTIWNNAYTYAGSSPTLGAAGMIGGGGFWLNWAASGNDNPIYSNDATGTAWTTSAATFEANTRTPNGDYADGVFLIPATNGIYRTDDHGVSITKVSTVATYAIAMSDDFAVAIDSSQTTCLVAPNPYTTFAAGVTHGVSLSSGSFIKYGNDRFLIGGQVAPGGLPKAVFANEDATTITAITLPTLSIGYVSAAAYDDVNGRWVIGTSAGQVCYMDEADGIWNLSTDTFIGGFGVRSIEWNGVVFVGCGTDNSSASTDYVKYSVDGGINWILAPTLAAVRPAMIKVMR